MSTILLNGPLQSSKPDTPPLSGARVQRKEDIEALQNPYVGQAIYVVEEGKTYYVRSLKSKVIGGIEVPNAAVDIYSDVFEELDIESRVYYDAGDEQIHLF